jgi:hypothetical protein
MPRWNKKAWEGLYGNNPPDIEIKSKKRINFSKTTEKKEAIIYYQWAQSIPLLADLLIHIANERECSSIQGHLLKLQGVKAGVSDYFLPLPIGKYHGMWLELKRDKDGIVSDLQNLWLQRMAKLGFKTFIAYGSHHAIQLTKEYLGEQKNV